MEKLLTMKEVAELLQVSEKTVKRIMERGELAGAKVGRAWRFTPADVKDYVERQKEMQ